MQKMLNFIITFLRSLACPDEKRRDLLTSQSRHWYALTGTFSGTPDVGVPRTVSCKSKLPVLDWTAAEAANLLLKGLDHIRLFGTFGFKQRQVPIASVNM